MSSKYSAKAPKLRTRRNKINMETIYNIYEAIKNNLKINKYNQSLYISSQIIEDQLIKLEEGYLSDTGGISSSDKS